MKKLGEQLELLFDWFVPFYERVLPKKPPKIPTHACMRAAATIADDKDPSSVPERGENTGICRVPAV